MPLALVLALVVASAPSDLAAIGIILSPRLERRTAVLHSAGRTRVVGVGDTAFGGRVAAIEADRVTVDFDGTPVVVRLNAAIQAVAPAPAPALTAAADAGPRAMERREIERRLGEESGRILAETTLVPAM